MIKKDRIARLVIHNAIHPGASPCRNGKEKSVLPNRTGHPRETKPYK